MSKLTAQPTAATVTPAPALTTWPLLEMPPTHPVFGMGKEHIDALQSWYSSVQGAVNKTFSDLNTALTSTQTNLKTTNQNLADANKTIETLSSQLKAAGK